MRCIAWGENGMKQINRTLLGWLLADLSLSDEERAEIAKCSVSTIKNARAELKQAPASPGLAEQIKRHIEATVPTQHIVARVQAALDNSKHWPTVLAAAKLLMEWQGYISPLQEAKLNKEEGSGRPAATLNLMVTRQPDLIPAGDAPDEKSGASEEEEPIDAEFQEAADEGKP